MRIVAMCSPRLPSARPPGESPRVWAALLVSGYRHGLVLTGLACRHTLRLEAGMPLRGHDLGPDLTPYEVAERIVRAAAG